MEDDIQPATSDEIKKVIESKPKFSWWVFATASALSGLAIFSLISDFTLIESLSNNIIIIIKIIVSLLLGIIAEVFRYNYTLRQYFNEADNLLKRILPQVNSQEFRRNLASRSKILDTTRRAAIKIEKTEIYGGRVVVLINRAINLRLGSILVLADETGELVAEFTVDNENLEFWSARNTENIDDLWLAPLSSQTNIWLGDYCRLYEVP